MPKRRFDVAASSSESAAVNLRDLAGVGGVPDAALAKIISRILPDQPVSRQRLSHASLDVLETSTRHCTLGMELEIPKSDGTSFRWAILSPQALLAHLTERSPQLAEVLRSMPPPSYQHPWGIHF